MTRTCDDLGVCNGRHCDDVSACPDYDLIACNSGNCPEHDHHPMRCPHASPARPTYPFAPGVIEGPAPMTRRALLIDLALLLASSAVMGLLASYLMEKFA